MKFLPYSIKQVSDILVSRCSEVFNEKAIGPDVIDEVSNITTIPAINGDIRYALDLLFYSGNLAESQGFSRINLEHIRKVHGQINPTIMTEDIEELSKNQKYTLMAVIRALRVKKNQYVNLKKFVFRL